MRFGFGLLLIVVIVSASVGIINSVNLIANFYYMQNNLMQRYNYANYKSTETMNLQRIVAMMGFYAGEPAVLGRQYIEATQSRDNLYAHFLSYRENLTTCPMMGADEELLRTTIARLDSLNELVTRYFDEVVEGMYANALAGNRDEMLRYVTIGMTLDSDIRAIQEQSRVFSYETIDEVSELVISVSTIIAYVQVAVVIVGLIVGLIVSVIISRTVTNSVNDAKEILDNVANGEFNVNMKHDLPQDEVGLMTRDIYRVVDVIKSILDDAREFIRDTVENGNLDLRMDTAKYSGGYKDLVEQLNKFADNSDADMFTLLNVLDKINHGDFNVTLAKLPGQKAVINEKVDELMSNLNSVSMDIEAMIDAAAVKGNLQFQIDVAEFKGDWRKLMKGLNEVAAAVNRPIVEIREAMTSLNAGMFDTKIDGNYAGDFLSIKNDVNQMIASMSSYVREIDRCLSSVAEGDLTNHISMDFEGEFNKIKKSIDHIVSTLHQTMSEISSASAQVLSGARQISGSASDLANGAQVQASSVEELNASIDMISQQTNQNAVNATEASALSLKSSNNAKEGNDSMNQMLDAMTQIRESSGNISKIIKAIQDIAFQTNLLSLNAAVEAARAGEHGKGFSVVAEEVRNLANRSQSAATETTGLIEESISRVESGSKIATSTSQSLDIIVSNAGEVLEYVTLISNASKEQADAIAQVSSGISQISQVVQSNSAVSQETAAASQELSSQAEVLQELVSFFKL